MALPKLNLDVPEESYSFNDGNGLLQADVSSGPPRVRVDMADAPLRGSMTLVMQPFDYQYFRAFYVSKISKGALPFLLDLMIDSPSVYEYEVQMVPSSYSTSRQGTAHMVQFDCFVKPRPIEDFGNPDTIIMLHDLYGSGGADVLNQLAHLVNVTLPQDVG